VSTDSQEEQGFAVDEAIPERRLGLRLAVDLADLGSRRPGRVEEAQHGRKAGRRDLAVEWRRFGKGVIVVGGHRQAGEGFAPRTGVDETDGEERRQSRREGRATNHKGASGVDLAVLVSGNRGWSRATEGITGPRRARFL